MRAIRLPRSALDSVRLERLVVAHDVRDAEGRIVLPKGTMMTGNERSVLAGAAWSELHLLAPDVGDLHESEAGARLVAAAAGDGVSAGAIAGGHWPLVAACRGVLTVRQSALCEVNRLNGIAIYTLYDGQVVDAGEVVGRAKVVPFMIDGETIERAERIGSAASGVVAVRRFLGTAVGAVVQETLGSGPMTRFRDAIAEKASWLGSELVPPRCVDAEADAITGAISDVITAGAGVVIVAGSRPMDPLDPAFEALARLGARVERQGVPAHPGSLLWMAWVRDVPVVGMPSCGLFSRATVFDLVFPRLLAGEHVDAEWLTRLGHGGLLTRDMAYRFPAYRPSRERGEVA